LQDIHLTDEILAGSGCFLQDIHLIDGISAALGLSLQGVAHIGWFFTRLLKHSPHRAVSDCLPRPCIHITNQVVLGVQTDFIIFNIIPTHWHNTMYCTRQADTTVQEKRASEFEANGHEKTVVKRCEKHGEKT
jgi:hypothetical protein